MKLKIYYANNQSKIKAGLKLKLRLRRAVCAALRYEKFLSPCSVSITFTDNEGIRELNRTYRGKDAATDVLSFPMYDFAAGEKPSEGLPAELGDIVLSLERAEEQAKELGHSFARESAFLAIHSVLHLLGYDHELSPEDDEDMCRRQRDIIKSIGL